MFSEETYIKATIVVENTDLDTNDWEDGVLWPSHDMDEADIAFSDYGDYIAVSLWELVNDGTERALCQTGAGERFTIIETPEVN